ncbi:MAG: hypothetical protein WCQ53_00305 [bacterium]
MIRVALILAIIIFPAGVLFWKGGYSYSIPFIFLLLLYVQFNDFMLPFKENYKKILTAIPLVVLFYWLSTSNTEHTTKALPLGNSDVKIAVILSCITIFVATTSILLILKRTKGEKIHD